MGNFLGNINLQDQDKLVIVFIAVAIILLVLFIMYKIDSLPEDYKGRKKHNFESDDEPEEDEDLESQIENENNSTAEEKMEELFMNNEIEEKPSFQLLDFGNTEEEAAPAEPEPTPVEQEEPVAKVAPAPVEPEPVVEPEIKTTAPAAEDDIDIYAGIDDTPAEPEVSSAPVAEPELKTTVPVAEDDIDIYAGIDDTPVEPEEKAAVEETVVEEPTTNAEDLHEANDIFANMNTMPDEPVDPVIEEPIEEETVTEEPKKEDGPYSMFTDNNQ